MDLNELIGYYTAKLAYPDLTQHSRNIANDTLNWLRCFQTITGESDYLIKRNTALEAELAVKDQAIAELRMNFEEMDNYIGEMARRGRK